MPLFSKTTFRSGKKPVKRKSVSLSNISSLDESVYSVNDLKLESGPLTLRLGEHELMFNKGQWISSKKNLLYIYIYNVVLKYTLINTDRDDSLV